MQVTDRAGGHRFLTSKAVLEGFTDPRVYVTAIGPRGQRCGLSLNPSNVTAEAATNRELLDAAREFRARTADARRDVQ